MVPFSSVIVPKSILFRYMGGFLPLLLLLSDAALAQSTLNEFTCTNLTVIKHSNLGSLSHGTDDNERFYPNVISRFTTNSAVGRIMIHSPISQTSGASVDIRVYGYTHSGDQIIDFRIVAWPSPSEGLIRHQNLVDRGTDGLSKYVGIDTNQKLAVAFGDSNSDISWCALFVDAFIAFSPTIVNGPDDFHYYTGWSVDQNNGSDTFWTQKLLLTSNSKLTGNSAVLSGGLGIGTGSSPLYEALNVGSAFSFHDGGWNIMAFEYSPSGGNRVTSTPVDFNNQGYAAGIIHRPTDGLLQFAVSTSTNNSYPNGDSGLSITKNERVGIGTSAPSTKLHVKGDTTLNGNLLFPTNTSSPYKIGLGITSPRELFQMYNPVDKHTISFHNGGHQVVAFDWSPTSPSVDLNTSAYAGEIRFDSVAGQLRLGVSTLTNNFPPTLVYVTKDQRLGINNSSPQKTLDVTGDVKISGSLSVGVLRLPPAGNLSMGSFTNGIAP